MPVVIYALLIVAGDNLYRHLALRLNDIGKIKKRNKCLLENYRTDDEYEDFLIAKIVLFQCVSAFSSLFYIAFYLQDMKRLREVCEVSSVKLCCRLWPRC